jgi:hypothetical protein
MIFRNILIYISISANSKSLKLLNNKNILNLKFKLTSIKCNFKIILIILTLNKNIIKFQYNK